MPPSFATYLHSCGCWGRIQRRRLCTWVLRWSAGRWDSWWGTLKAAPNKVITAFGNIQSLYCHLKRDNLTGSIKQCIVHYWYDWCQAISLHLDVHDIHGHRMKVFWPKYRASWRHRQCEKSFRASHAWGHQILFNSFEVTLIKFLITFLIICTMNTIC